MSRGNCTILDNGNLFPSLTISSSDGSVIALPEDFGERWNVLLFYRGHW